MTSTWKTAVARKFPWTWPTQKTAVQLPQKKWYLDTGLNHYRIKISQPEHPKIQSFPGKNNRTHIFQSNQKEQKPLNIHTFPTQNKRFNNISIGSSAWMSQDVSERLGSVGDVTPI